MVADNDRQIGPFDNSERVCSQADAITYASQHKQENKTACKSTKKTGLARRNRGLTKQTGYQKGSYKEASRNFSSLLDPQTKGRFSHGFESKKAKPLYSKLNIQDGKSFQHTPSHQEKRLGGIHRSSRCLSSRSHCSGCTAPLRLRSGKQNVSVSGSAIRPQDGTPHLHTNCTDNRSPLASEGYQDFCLSRRLACSGRLRKHASSSSKHNARSGHQTRLSDKLQKVSSRTHSKSRVFGCKIRPKATPCSPPFSQSRQSTSGRAVLAKQNSSSGQILAPVFGPTRKPHGHCIRVQTEDENNPNGFLKSVSPSKGPIDESGHAHGNHDTGRSLVAYHECTTGRKAFRTPSSIPDNSHRCIKLGMGCCSRIGPSSRSLGRKGKGSAHKHIGNASHTTCSIQFQRQNSEENCSDKVRQPHSSILRKQAGGHKIKRLVQSNPRNSRLVRFCRDKDYSLTHTREGQLCGRFPVKGQLSPFRVATRSKHCQTDIQQIRASSSRPVCVDSEQATTSLLHEAQRSSSTDDGCLHNVVGQFSGVCIPSFRNDIEGITESSRGRSNSSIDSSLVAETPMVSNAGEPSDPSSDHTPGQEGSSQTTRDNDLSPQCDQSKVDVMDHFRKSASQAGLSERVAELSAKFLRSSTRTTYDSRLHVYFKWCNDKEVDPTSAPVGEIADFLMHLFDKNLAISTIRGYRSAIQAIHRGFEDGLTVSSSIYLTRLIKSLFLSRPPQKKLSPSWSLSRVLRALSKAPFEPMHSSSLANLTMKTIFLIAVACGRRRSFLHALSNKPGHIRWEINGVRLIPHAKFVAKNQTMNSSPGETFIPSLKSLSSVSQDKLWCPVRALKWYLHRTKDLRTSDNLFVSINSPHGSVSPDTISRWIVQAIKAGGVSSILSQKVRAHDTRGIASSWALFQGVPLDDILKAAYWHNPNTFTSCYLSDVISSEAAFASAVLSCPNRK